MFFFFTQTMQNHFHLSSHRQAASTSACLCVRESDRKKKGGMWGVRVTCSCSPGCRIDHRPVSAFLQPDMLAPSAQTPPYAAAMLSRSRTFRAEICGSPSTQECGSAPRSTAGFFCGWPGQCLRMLQHQSSDHAECPLLLPVLYLIHAYTDPRPMSRLLSEPGP